jgi:hypothetical protein
VNRRLVVLFALVVGACGGISPSGPQPLPSCGGDPQASLGCFEPTPIPSGGITREDAITIARRSLPGGAGAQVVWASVESNPYATPNATGPIVWEVRLEGEIGELACPSDWLDRWPAASDPPCLDNDSGIVAVLDYYSGVLIGWLH